MKVLRFFLLVYILVCLKAHEGHDHSGGSTLVTAKLDNCKQFILDHAPVQMWWTLSKEYNNISFRFVFPRGGYGWAAMGLNKEGHGMPHAHIVMGIFSFKTFNLNN